MTTVLALYPPAQRFQRELEDRYGPIDVRTVPALRRQRPLQLLRTLRSIEGQVVLAFETPGAEQGLPALRALAALTRASAVSVVSPGCPPVPTGRAEAAAALAGVARASVHGFGALAATEWATRTLLREARMPARPDLARGVLLLNSSPWIGLSTGGAVAHTVGVANAFAAEGIRTAVATYTATPGLRTDVVRTTMPSFRSYAVPPELNRFRLGRLTSELAGNPGVVYERLSLGSTAGAVLSRQLGVPLVVEYNGSEIWAARHWGGTTRFERAALRAEQATLRHAHLVVTVSEPLVAELLAHGLTPERVLWHPNGVDPDRFDPTAFTGEALRGLRHRYGIADEAILVTFVGSFGNWHGAEVLARVAARTAQRQSPSLHFLFVGDGARSPQVGALLEGVEHATLAGAVPADEIPIHLAASDVLVSPHVQNPDGSAFFGSPTKLFEYMAAGKAIVASDLDQISEVLAGDSAVLVRPGDEDDLLRGIDEVASDPARRETLGRHARERVIERYTWTHQVRAILAAIGRIDR